MTRTLESRSHRPGHPRWQADARTFPVVRYARYRPLPPCGRERRARWPTSVVRVVVAEPNHVVRLGLVAALDASDEVTVVATVDDAEALEEAVVEHQVDVVLMNLDLDPARGIALLEEISGRSDTLAIGVAREVTDADMLEVFGRGACGLVLLDSIPSMLPTAVQAVAAGGVFIDPQIAGTIITVARKGQPGSHGPFDLTVQQQRVLALLPDGLTNPEIGEELGISPNTVKAHLRKAMEKIGAHDRIEAAEIVEREGLA